MRWVRLAYPLPLVQFRLFRRMCSGQFLTQLLALEAAVVLTPLAALLELAAYWNSSQAAAGAVEVEIALLPQQAGHVCLVKQAQRSTQQAQRDQRRR